MLEKLRPLVGAAARPSLLPRPSPLGHSRRHSSSYRRFGDPPRLPPGSGQSSSYDYRLPFNLRRPPNVVLLVGGGAIAWVVTHLEQVPETGRWRFLDTPTAMEKAIGEQTLQEVMREYQHNLLPASHPTARYVQRVVKRLTAASHLTGGDGGWETYVINSDVQNA